MIGHVQGGWEYIWAAYFLSWAGMALFGASLVPAGRNQFAIRQAIAGALLVLAGGSLWSFGGEYRDPFTSRTLLLAVCLGGGALVLASAAMQLIRQRQTRSEGPR